MERRFVLTGLVFLLAGMAGLHAYLNLLGFVLMTLFAGLFYTRAKDRTTWPDNSGSI